MLLTLLSVMQMPLQHLYFQVVVDSLYLLFPGLLPMKDTRIQENIIDAFFVKLQKNEASKSAVGLSFQEALAWQAYL